MHLSTASSWMAIERWLHQFSCFLCVSCDAVEGSYGSASGHETLDTRQRHTSFLGLGIVRTALEYIAFLSVYLIHYRTGCFRFQAVSLSLELFGVACRNAGDLQAIALEMG